VIAHPELDTTTLQLGRAIDVTLRGPQVHRYRLAMHAGQFAAVQLRQLEGNLAAVVFDPDGRLIDIVDQNGAGQAEVATIVADTTGDYAIQVAIFEWDTPAVRYAIEWHAIEPAQREPVARARQLFRSWYDPARPGAAIIVLQDGRVAYEDAIGRANVEGNLRLTTHTPVDLASVSKQFTGFAIALLADRGKLRLDDDVRRYVPELPDYGSRITLRHLLEHTSGLRDWDGLFGLTGRRIEDGISMDAVLAMLARQKTLNFAPGSRQQYSNSGYVVLALVVERVTGQPFDRWLQAEVLQPLGMQQCRIERAPAARDLPDTDSYGASWPVPLVASHGPMITLGSSSLACSAHDLRTWLDNYASGKLGGPAVQTRVTQEEPASEGRPNDYVYGNWHATRDSVKVVGHQGLAAGYRTSVHSFPERRLAVIYLANDGNDATYPRVRQIEDLFLGIAAAPIEAPTDDYLPAPRPALGPAAIVDYVGNYVSDELPATYAIEATGSGIALHHPALGIVPLLPQGPDAFATANAFLPALTFVRDERARVTGFTIQSEDVGSLPFRRVTP
jgi:CubicO group peptidase (beta-lactamase class C family)